MRRPVEDVESSTRDRLGRADADERLTRLPVAHLGLEALDLLGQDVRRVRDDEIPGTGGKAAAETPFEQRDREPGPRRVRAGDLESPAREVDSGDTRARTLVDEREGDRAAPGSDVEDARLVQPGKSNEATVDDDLGLRTRDEDTAIDAEQKPRKPHSPSTYASGSRASRRETSRSSSLSSRRDSLRDDSSASCERVRPATCADKDLGVCTGRLAASHPETLGHEPESVPNRTL